MDTRSEAKLVLIFPPLADIVRNLAQAFVGRFADGDTLEVVQGFRSWSDQQKLWLEGRDQDGNVIDESKIVTNARPGYSWHEFGCAVDVAPASVLSIPGWSPKDPKWFWIEQAAQGFGLVSGEAWRHPDEPHVQLTGRFPVTPNDEARQIYKNEGQQAFWNEVQESLHI